MEKIINKKKKMTYFIIYAVVVLGIIYTLTQHMNSFQWSIFNWISTISGILCVVLVAQKDIRNYYIGVIAVVSYGAVAFHSGYVYDYLLNIYFLLPVQIVGIYFWDKHVKEDNKNIVKPALLKYKKLIFSISIIAILLLLTTVYDSVVIALRGLPSDLPFILKIFDASTTVLTIIAQILMILRYKEQWVLWIVINILSIIMWIYFKETSMVVMWSVYLINAIYGYKNWE